MAVIQAAFDIRSRDYLGLRFEGREEDIYQFPLARGKDEEGESLGREADNLCSLEHGQCRESVARWNKSGR